VKLNAKCVTCGQKISVNPDEKHLPHTCVSCYFKAMQEPNKEGK
jgi:DNA-directed RNA polymerase subunit RPC12/RpoP